MKDTVFSQIQHTVLSYELIWKKDRKYYRPIYCQITLSCVFQSCKEQVDAILFLFSFTDRASFDDLPNQMAKWAGEPAGKVVKLVVGTKYP